MSFLAEFKEKVGEQTDSPPLFIQGAAYYLMSSTVGQFYRASAAPYQVQRPNLWVILSSIPGRMRRSTLQNMANRIYSNVIGELAPNTILEDGTPEGITDAITEGIEAYTIQSTELGSVLIRCRKSDSYSAGTLGLWSKLYYGESGVQHFSKRQGGEPRVLPAGLYVTMMAGLQEPSLYFDETMLRQGLLRRLIIIYQEKSQKWLDPLRDIHEGFSLDSLCKPLNSRRMENLQMPDISVILDPDAKNIVNAYAKKNDAALDTLPDLVNLYRQSYWEHALKIATLEAIDETQGRQPVTVTTKNVEKALYFISDYSEAIEPEIQKFGQDKETTRSHETDFQKIIRAIGECKEGYATRTTFIKKFRWTADETEKIIRSMVEGELIDAFTVQVNRSRIYQVYTLHGEMVPWISEHLKANLPGPLGDEI